MNIQPTNQQPISDDQELAKVLAGITASADQAAASTLSDDLNQDAAPASTPAPVTPTEDSKDDMIGNPEAAPQAPSTPSFDPITPSAPVTPLPAAPTGDLESIKNDALSELRPLVDKLNVSPQEKFDTYLLLIRSTDDTALISPAFAAARGITDEAAKAQALLDIVKEIDYLSNPQKPVA